MKSFFLKAKELIFFENRYTGYRYSTALIFSVLLGWLAVDRFYLGYCCIGIGKILTLGGLGVWWLVDLVLLIKGEIMPADGSLYEYYY